MDKFATALGKFCVVVGGLTVALLVLAILVWLMAMAWIGASNRWRGICKAESLIHEYRRERKQYLYWKRFVAEKTIPTQTNTVETTEEKEKDT